MRTWFTLLGFKSRRVRLLICLATPCKLVVMFRFVEAIALDAFSLLESTQEYYMSPLPAVLVLRDIWVYVGISDSCNIAFYVEASVNEFFSLTATLAIPYVDPDNGHVKSGRYLDNMRPRC